MNINFKLLDLKATSHLAHILSILSQPNLIILLNGNLGAGKTQLTKLIGKNLGINETITSPTFVILNQYQTNKDWKLVHIDAYRLNKTTDFNEYYELMINNFTIIEWANNISFNFTNLKTITLNINFDNNQRNVTLITNNLTKKEEDNLSSSYKKQKTQR